MGLGLEEPEDLEQLGMQKVREGKVKDGLKLILRAARGYEEAGRKKEAARLYRYLGYFLLKKTGAIEKARPSLLKSAYLYVDLIEREISRPEVDLDVLDEYCFNVLEVFATTNDRRNLVKYAEEFASIYEDLGDSYQENDDIPMAIRAYESAYWYYRLVDNIEGYKKLAETIITLYGQVAEEKLEKGDTENAAVAFYRLATYIKAIFGYDIHFIEMMDTAAKNFEKASKIAYSEGDLDRTTTYLVRAQYAYLLAKNFNRAKLIGLNTVRMLYQVISSYRGRGDEERAAEKLMEISEALIGMGKFEDAIETYKGALDYTGQLPFRVRIRLAVLKKLAASNTSSEVLDDVEHVEYYLRKGKYGKALELAEKAMKREELRKMLKSIHEAEGIY
ncbi:hypothetical protein [Thermococcus sp. M36]|uniref:hypothetical protein n=1 Tax=Thermococcus sp. M36 TaxID=1638261 RepID=UPI00318405F8